MFKASWDFIVLSLDGSCAVEEHLEEDQPASALDHYVSCPATSTFQDMTFSSPLHHAEGVQLRAIKEEEESHRHCQ